MKASDPKPRPPQHLAHASRHGQSVRRVIASTTSDGSGFDLKYLLGVIRRRKVIILTTVCLVTTLSAVVSLHLTPRYTATSAVMIEPRQIRAIGLDAPVEEFPPDEGMVETQIRVLTSRSHAERVIDELQLLADEELNPVLRPKNDRAGSSLASLADWLPTNWLTGVGRAEPISPHVESGAETDPNTILSRKQQLEIAAARYLDRLQVSKHGRSYVISISFVSTDAKKSARIANAAAQLFVEEQLQEKLTGATRAAKWLADRVEQLRERVLESERTAAEYRAGHRLGGEQRTSLHAEQLARITVDLIATRAERAEKELRLRQARAMRADGAAYAALTEVMSSPIIIRLREQEAELLSREAELSREYGPRHPMMLQLGAEKRNLAIKIDSEVQNIIRNLENEGAVARRREQELEDRLEEAEEASARSSHARIELEELEREARVNRSLYETLLGRLKEIQGQQQLLQPGVKVISAAQVPQSPSFPKPKLITAVGFTVSLVLSTLIASVREQLDSRLRTGRSLQEVLGVGSLGLVPSLRPKNGQQRHRHLLERPLSAYAEGVRGVQRAIQTSNPQMPPRVVLVTSAIPEEGKTTLAASLAASAVRSNARAVLVDLDLRHPSVAREMDWECGTDLVDYLTGKAPLDAIIYADPFQRNLHFIPVKQLTSQPIDLLESQKMISLLAELRANYDYVVLDAPPVLGITDAKVIGPLADAVLLVVRWGKTRAEVTAAALDALVASHVEVTGIVLSRVNLRRHAKYGYGDVGHYYNFYKQYYVN
jgi:succinoglycan biosynthesis transport protein ExoP